MGTRSLQTNGSVVVGTGTSVTLTAEEVIMQGDDRYEFSKWTVDGVDADTTLTINVTADDDKAVEAVYVLVPTEPLVMFSDLVIGMDFSGSPVELWAAETTHTASTTNYKFRHDVFSAPGTYMSAECEFVLYKLWNDGQAEPAEFVRANGAGIGTLDGIAVKNGWKVTFYKTDGTACGTFVGDTGLGSIYVSGGVSGLDEALLDENSLIHQYEAAGWDIRTWLTQWQIGNIFRQSYTFTIEKV